MKTDHGVCRRLSSLILCLLLIPLPVLAEGGSAGNQSAGQISALVPAATRNTQIAKLREEIDWNDLLKTDRSGRTRISLKDGSILSLGSDSELMVVQHNVGAQQTELQLNFGRLRSRVVSLSKPGARFEVRTPVAVAGVVGTDFFVEYNPASATFRVICYSGRVMVTGVGPYAGSSNTIQAGQMIELGSNGLSAPQTTPNAVQQDSIAETAAEGSGSTVASESHLLRNVLIGAAVAAAGVVVGLVATGGEKAAQPQTGTAAGQKKGR